MADNIVNINEYISKRDLQMILEVNKKSIEIENAVADQNEEVIELLTKAKTAGIDNTKNIKVISETQSKIVTKIEDLSRELFVLKVLLGAGVINLIVQVVTLVTKLH